MRVSAFFRTRRLITTVTSVLVACAVASGLFAQITVNPTGVNVASQGATTVFLTFGGLGADFVAAEAFWCGELEDARPATGLRCDESTLFGRLPIRFDLAQSSGTGALTDIMSIPPSVARRAYQAAAGGQRADFFYVRRFVSRSGARDVYVAVTCRLTGGGATSPLSLVDVRLAFATEAPVVTLEPGVTAPAWAADITYSGTGRLQGRWEVVRPGEEVPSEDDLLTEASLPMEQRGSQRRWTQLERFNVLLPAGGRVRLPGPDPSRLPRQVDGVYLVLLRVEASQDRDGQTDLSAVGAGAGVISSGAVSGFAMPTLRYLVGSGGPVTAVSPSAVVTVLTPEDGATMPADTSVTFVWQPSAAATQYRLEFAGVDGPVRFEAIVGGAVAAYRAPPFLVARVGAGAMRWRVRAFDASGSERARSAWRRITLTK